MHELALERPRYDVDYWLKDVVAAVLESSDSINIDRAELWTLLDSLPVAILISTDRSCSRIVGNRAAQSLLKVPLGSNLSQSAPTDDVPAFGVFAGGEPVPVSDLPMQRAAATGQRVGRSECEIRFDGGGTVFLAGHCIPIKDETGEVCGSLGAFVDITEQKMGFEAAELVAREMHHRVGNVVAIIQAMAHGTIRDRLGAQEFADFEGRLANMARAQNLVTIEKNAAIALIELIEGAVIPVVGSAHDRVSMVGPSATVGQDDALALSMVIHELTTNACKYGALRTGGRVDISWKFEQSPSGITPFRFPGSRPVVLPAARRQGEALGLDLSSALFGLCPVVRCAPNSPPKA